MKGTIPVDAISQLGSILGLSFISGINLYATVAVTGLCVRNGLVTGLPPQFQVFGNDAVIFIALLLYAVEFFADKIQGLDILWDGLHTFIRPLGGALIALIQVGEASAPVEVIVFLLGAAMASAAHATKAGTRLVVNASPEPVSNIVVSMGEDIGAVAYTYLALSHPRLTFFLTLACLVLIAILLPMLFRTLRMLLGSLFFRLKRFFVRESGADPAPALPLEVDRVLDAEKETGETILWAGKAFAAGIPSVRRSARIYLVMTSLSVYCLYRRWFRLRIRRMPRSEIRQYRCYPGRLLGRCLVKSHAETWLVRLYSPFMESLPRDLAIPVEPGS